MASFLRILPTQYLCILTFLLSLPIAVRADELEETALKIAPHDAAFFFTNVHLKESWNDFSQTRLVTRLRSVPYTQRLEAALLAQWEEEIGPLGQNRAMLESPIAQNVYGLVSQMLSDEIFVYGSSEWSDMFAKLVLFQQEIAGRDPTEVFEYWQSLTKEDLTGFEIPTTVIGCRIEDIDNAKLLLDALEGLCRTLGSQIDEALPFLEKLKRWEFEEGQSLVLSLDTSLIPLDQMSDMEQAMFGDMLKLLEDYQLSIGLGVKQGMLLVAIGPEEDLIENVGASEKSLFDHPSIEFVRSKNPKGLRGFSYASKEFVQGQWEANFGTYFQNIAGELQTLLDEQAFLYTLEKDISDSLEEWSDQIQADAKWLDEKIASFTIEYGPTMSWSRKINGGYETHRFSGTKSRLSANAAPLSILRHAGSSPLVLLATKQGENEIAHEMVLYLLEKVPGHLKQLLQIAEENVEDRALANRAIDEGMPIIRDIYNVLHNMIGKATSDNEAMLAISGQWTMSEDPLGNPLPKPLPLPEVALAFKVTDRELFEKGCADLFDQMDRLVNMVRRLEPDLIPPDYQIPRPTAEDRNGITKFSYPELLAFMSDAPPGFVPQVSVSDEAVVVGYSNDQVQEMLSARPLRHKPTWLKADTPVSSVTYVDFAGTIRAIGKWVEFSMLSSGVPMDEPLGPSTATEPVPTGEEVLQLWSCLTSLGKLAVTTTVQEDGTIVSRSVWVED